MVLNFGASDVLLQQIVKGAPADVFASADQKAMDKAVEEKAVKPASRVDFAANQVVLIVPTDSRANITALKDLTRDDVKRIAYGNPASVPVGRYTQGALQAAGLWDAVQAKSVLAQNVRQSLTMCRAARSTPASCSPPTPPSWRTRSRSPCACRRRRPSPIPSP